MALALPFGASPSPAAGAPAGGGAYSSGATGANPYGVNFGNIPFAQSQFPTGIGDLASTYQNNYSNALNFNQSLGNTINAGYNNAMQQQLGGQAGVMDTIANYGKSARQDLIDQNASRMGDVTQSMIGRGLGNTTVLDSAQRGVNYDTQKGNLQLDDQLAAMKAGYQNQFIQQNTGQANAQSNFLERMTGAYPQAGLYAQLAQQYGAAGQSAQNQAAYQDQLKKLQQAGYAGSGVSGAVGGGGGGQRQSAFGPQFYQPGTPSPGVTPTGGGFAPQYGQTQYGVGLGAGAYDSGGYDYGNPGDFITWDGSGGGAYGAGGDWGGDTVPGAYDLSGEDQPYGGQSFSYGAGNNSFDPFSTDWSQ